MKLKLWKAGLAVFNQGNLCCCCKALSSRGEDITSNKEIVKLLCFDEISQNSEEFWDEILSFFINLSKILGKVNENWGNNLEQIHLYYYNSNLSCGLYHVDLLSSYHRITRDVKRRVWSDDVSSSSRHDQVTTVIICLLYTFFCLNFAWLCGKGANN